MNEEVNEEEHRLLGDIYISVDKAKSQALEYGHSFKREICFFIIQINVWKRLLHSLFFLNYL